MRRDAGRPLLLPAPRRAEWTGQRVDRTEPPVVAVGDPTLPPQGYRLFIEPDGAVGIEAADDAGAFYARCTLEQLRGVDGTVPAVRIEDWPDVAVRGVMLDVSRDKVPTLETLEALVDRLARLKINHLQLYLEHTFAHQGHEAVWAGASPYTADDIRRLDEFCRARHVELAPNRNCLGHMERWLVHEAYRSMAVDPDARIEALGGTGPTTLDPSSAAARRFVASLLAELLPAFTSERAHVGLDEPWELPDERFDDYLDFLRWLLAEPVLAGREVLMWGDVVAHHPDRLADLPDVTICEWGYGAAHPFDERCRRLAEAGRPFWTCPGTSSWQSLVPRASTAIANITAAVDAARADGGGGVLVTDWGDRGHLQPLSLSEPLFALAGARSWCASTNTVEAVVAACDTHVFDAPASGITAALVALGDAELALVPRVPNMSTICTHLYRPRWTAGERATAGLTLEDLDEARGRLASAHATVTATPPGRADGALVVAELDQAVALLDLLCRESQARLRGDGSATSVPAPLRQAFAGELEALAAEHGRLWLARNRPGGLDRSLSFLRAPLTLWTPERPSSP